MTNEQAAKSYAWAQHGYSSREQIIAEKAFMAGIEYRLEPIEMPYVFYEEPVTTASNETIIRDAATYEENPEIKPKRGRKKKE